MKHQGSRHQREFSVMGTAESILLYVQLQKKSDCEMTELAFLRLLSMHEFCYIILYNRNGAWSSLNICLPKPGQGRRLHLS